MQFTNINGVEFEVTTGKKQYVQRAIERHLSEPRKQLRDCYIKPSPIKQDIWNNWLEWFWTAPEVGELSITSYNGFQFTIGAIYYDENDTPIGYIQITKAHNHLFLAV